MYMKVVAASWRLLSLVDNTPTCLLSDSYSCETGKSMTLWRCLYTWQTKSAGRAVSKVWSTRRKTQWWFVADPYWLWLSPVSSCSSSLGSSPEAASPGHQPLHSGPGLACWQAAVLHHKPHTIQWRYRRRRWAGGSSNNINIKKK